MFEASISLIPSSIWTAAYSWFTPTVFFILLNIVIGTIVVTSSLTPRHQHPSKQDLNLQQNTFFRSSSVLQRLRSINFYGYKYNDPDPLGEASVSDESNLSDKLQTSSTEHHRVFEQTHIGEETEEAKSMDEVYGLLSSRHVTRSRSEPAKLPAKMRKSDCMKSDSGHGHLNKDDAVVESRRPTTARNFLSEADEEVDAKADDFINRFKEQLKLQRLDSILRSKKMIGSAEGRHQTKQAKLVA